MALIKCPNCGQDISDKAEKCPHCGWEKKREKKNKEGKFKMPSNQYIVFGGIVVAAMLICIIVCVGITNNICKRYEKSIIDTIQNSTVKEERTLEEASLNEPIEEEKSEENASDSLKNEEEDITEENITEENPTDTVWNDGIPVKDSRLKVTFDGWDGLSTTSTDFLFTIINSSDEDVSIKVEKYIFLNKKSIRYYIAIDYMETIPAGKATEVRYCVANTGMNFEVLDSAELCFTSIDAAGNEIDNNAEFSGLNMELN
nr:MAG TPA: LysW biosynthesis protein LysW [Bacteriophage sp.]